MASDLLLVVFEEQIVGKLWPTEADRCLFEYDSAWLVRPDAFAISLSLPLSAQRFSDERPGRFFANLLPEGQLRTLLARRFGISENNDFALLRRIGGECAGALSLVSEPDERERPSAGDGDKRLEDDDLGLLARSPPALIQALGDGKARLSLAGAQNKLPVLVRGEEVFLPQGRSPSSHILKMPSRDFAHLPANEVLISWLAREAGIHTADVRLLATSGGHLCLVTRYDRRRQQDGTLVRIHQEDFCQALGLDARTKYAAEGGPSFPRVFDLLSRVSVEPLPDTEQLLRWQIFNLLCGNADGHAKNLSLLYDPGGNVRLAPFYDLVCTRAYSMLDWNLAMPVGQRADPGLIAGSDFRQLAEQIGATSRYVLGVARDLAHALPEHWKAVSHRFDEKYGQSPAIQVIGGVIGKQCRRTLQLLDG